MARSERTSLEELLYVHTHSSRKRWTVHRFGRPSGVSGDAGSLSLDEFELRLKKELELYIDDVTAAEKEEAFWLRIVVIDDMSLSCRARSSVTYAVHYPHTEFVIFNGLSAAHRDFILQAFLTLLQAQQAEELPLSGHQVTSLAQLAINRYCQGDFSRFRLNQVDVHPLSHRQPRKPAALDESDFDCHLVSENVQEKQMCKESLGETFGPNKQPVLERLDYKLETNFHGQQFAPAMSQNDEIFHCRVRFEGSSVLEGLRNLAAAGLADLPMRDHLGKVHSMARSTIVLRKKTSQSSSQSQSS